MTTQSASSGWWARFTFNGITRYDQGAFGLVGGEELSGAEREELLQLCRSALMPSECDAARRYSPTGAATAPRSAARSKSGCSPGPRAAANAAAHTSIKGLWRPTPSCPKTRVALTTSVTCSPSASAATPATYGRREAGCVFCALEVSGRVLLENELALFIADAFPVTPWHSLVIPRRHGSRNKIRWAGTVRWSAARPQEPAWPASDHGWPASSARNLR
jgi:ATP adenylyltransferase